MRTENNPSFGILFALVLTAAMITGCGYCWQYSLNTWAEYVHYGFAIYFWQGMLLAMIPFIGQASIPLAAATWVLMLFLC
jgi:hypothetical protein